MLIYIKKNMNIMKRKQYIIKTQIELLEMINITEMETALYETANYRSRKRKQSEIEGMIRETKKRTKKKF